MVSFGLSERRCCRLVSLPLTTRRYRPRERVGDLRLRERMRELADQHKRWGMPLMHMILKKEGLVINHKRTERIYNEENLSLRRKRRKRRGSWLRTPMTPVERKCQRWSMDFIHDSMLNGRKMKCLTIVDDYTRESPHIEVGSSIGGKYVVRVFEQLRLMHGLPESIRTDNGPEFTSRAFVSWCLENKIEHIFSRPGKPTDNPYIESFNGRFRDECLNENYFLHLDDAKIKIEAWREIYNEIRPHSSLGGLSPKEFANGLEVKLAS